MTSTSTRSGRKTNKALQKHVSKSWLQTIIRVTDELEGVDDNVYAIVIEINEDELFTAAEMAVFQTLSIQHVDYKDFINKSLEQLVASNYTELPLLQSEEECESEDDSIKRWTGWIATNQCVVVTPGDTVRNKNVSIRDQIYAIKCDYLTQKAFSTATVSNLRKESITDGIHQLQKLIAQRIKRRVSSVKSPKIGFETKAEIDLIYESFNNGVTNKLKTVEFFDTNPNNETSGVVTGEITVHRFKRYLQPWSTDALRKKAMIPYYIGIDNIKERLGSEKIELEYSKSAQRLFIRFAVNSFFTDGSRYSLV